MFVLRSSLFTCCYLFISTWAVSAPLAAPSFRNNSPSPEKQHFCERLVLKFGHRSQDLNSHWYGKGVKRPARSDWNLHHTKKPWLLADRLMYVFRQTTSDGFEHTASCTWDTDGFYDMKIQSKGHGSVLICYYDGEQDGMGC